MKLPTVPKLGWIVPILGIGLIAYFLGHRDGTLTAASRAATEQAQAVLHAGRAYQTRLDSLRIQSYADSIRADSLQRAVDSAKAVYESVAELPAKVGTASPDSVAARLGLEPIVNGYRADTAQVREFAEWGWRANVTLPALQRLYAVTDSLLTLNRDRLETMSLRASLAEARADALTTALSDLVDARSCRFLFWSCPSRGTMFVGGLVIGLIVTKASGF